MCISQIAWRLIIESPKWLLFLSAISYFPLAQCLYDLNKSNNHTDTIMHSLNNLHIVLQSTTFQYKKKTRLVFIQNVFVQKYSKQLIVFQSQSHQCGLLVASKDNYRTLSRAQSVGSNASIFNGITTARRFSCPANKFI